MKTRNEEQKGTEDMNEEELKGYLNTADAVENNARLHPDVVESIANANKSRPMNTDQKRAMIAGFKAKAKAMREQKAN